MTRLVYFESALHKQEGIALSVVNPADDIDRRCYLASGYIEVDESIARDMEAGIQRRKTLKARLDAIEEKARYDNQKP